MVGCNVVLGANMELLAGGVVNNEDPVNEGCVNVENGGFVTESDNAGGLSINVEPGCVKNELGGVYNEGVVDG